MEEPRYPAPKRRRTSSADSSHSRSRSRSPSRSSLRRHAPPSSSRRERERSYSTSPSRSASRDRPARDPDSRTLSPSRRRSPSSAASTTYSSARSHHSPRRPSEGSWHDDDDDDGTGGGPDNNGNDATRAHAASRSPSPPPPPRSRKFLSFAPLCTLPRAHARGITTAKFSPDMKLLATAGADATINIYSVTSPPAASAAGADSGPRPGGPQFKLLRTLRAHLAGINQIAWSPNGPPYTLASASDDKSILLWAPLSSDFPIAPSPLRGHSHYVYSLAFSPKGNMLVSGSFDEAVFLWDVRSARIMRSLPAHSDPVGGVDFLRDGTMVASCAGDGLIRVWDAGTGQCLKTLVDEARKGVTSVRFVPNGRYLVAWTLDGCVRLWRYGEGRCVKTYTGHVNGEYSLGGAVGDYWCAGRQEAFVASGSEDGDVLVWDVVSKDVLWRGRGHKDVVLALDFGRDEAGKGLLVSVGRDRDVRVWSLEEGEQAARAGEMEDMQMQMEMDAQEVVHDMGAHGDEGAGGDGMEVDGDPTPNAVGV